MTTLKAIGFTLAGGSVVFAASFAAFGLAVRSRSEKIAPRATARPRNVIYNPSAPITSPQYRGNPVWGWIPWTLRLNYDTLLRGVPGTGTRQGGLAGTMLHVTLDGIVLLRFHAVGRRIAALATLLCLLLLLPLYLSAPCLTDYHGTNKYMEFYQCNTTLISNYRQTTLSHVPDMEDGMFGSLQRPAYGSIMFRLYAAVFVVWAITLYAFKLLHVEWIELVQLRRIYYLERTTITTRGSSGAGGVGADTAIGGIDSSTTTTTTTNASANKESEWTARLRKRPSFDGSDDGSSISQNQQSKQHRSSGCYLDSPNIVPPGEEHLVNRDPWIPHPEQPDTVPNVEPYTILLGHIPSMVHQHHHNNGNANAMTGVATLTTNKFGSAKFTTIDGMNDLESAAEAATATRVEQIHRQLHLIKSLFEKALPHEPGYSSPIAAVTIVPCANQVGKAWRKWYLTATKMRRLKLVRQQIQKRRRGSILEEEEAAFVNGGGIADNAAKKKTSKDVIVDEEAPIIERMTRASSSSLVGSGDKANNESSSGGDGNAAQPTAKARRRRKSRLRQSQYFEQVLGSVVDEDDIKNDAVAFGPEQTAVYSRELAQAASNCCPYGFMEGRVYKADLDTLLDMEQELEFQLHSAKQELDYARRLFLSVPEPGSDDEDDSMVGGGVETDCSCAMSPTGSVGGISGSPVISRLIGSGGARRGVARTSSIGDGERGTGLELPDLHRQTSRSRSLSPSRKLAPRMAPVGQGGADRGSAMSSTSRATSMDSDAGPPFDSEMQQLKGSYADEEPPLQYSHHRYAYHSIMQDLRDCLRLGRLLVDEIREKKWKILPLCAAALTRESSYAVVTFTSRQAAAAARQCLTDGNHEIAQLMTLHEIPIPPLADAAAWKLLPCRYFCRPVTVTLNNLQKNLRLYMYVYPCKTFQATFHLD